MDILNSIDLNYVYAILLVFGLLGTKIWLLPYLKTKGINQKYYNLIEQSLLLGNMMFRSEKISKIFDIAVGIVSTLEVLDSLDSNEKHTEAVGELAQKLLVELNIQLCKDTLDSIIRIAVAFMGDK